MGVIMAEAGLAAQRSQHRLLPGDAGEFSPWLNDPRRHFLRDLTVKLLIGFRPGLLALCVRLARARRASGPAPKVHGCHRSR
jgi:hypothetical protein